MGRCQGEENVYVSLEDNEAQTLFTVHNVARLSIRVVRSESGGNIVCGAEDGLWGLISSCESWLHWLYALS